MKGTVQTQVKSLDVMQKEVSGKNDPKVVHYKFIFIDFSYNNNMIAFARLHRLNSISGTSSNHGR